LDITTVNAAFSSLDRWIADNGWAGYDPYDIRGQDWYVKLFGTQNAFFRKVRGALALLEYRIPPLGLRKFLRIRKKINAKGMGLFASAYLTQGVATGDPMYNRKAEEVLTWLADNQSRGYPGVSWGYPFHWQSRVFLPKGTPSSVVTATVGDAWLQHYQATQSPRSLDLLEGIADFFQTGLNRPVEDDQHLCFSYTPLDQFKVHNASLFAAAFLARFGAVSGRADLETLALKAVRYTLSEQNSDGSFYYWGSEPATIIDHYHTGFVLRHLDTVRSTLSADFIDEPLSRGYNFYINQLFTQAGIPKFTPDSLYPVDIHSCTEALLCICQLGPRLGGLERLGPVFEFMQEKMLSPEGWYFAAILERKARKIPVRIPYIRWGQAWMLLALAKLQLRLSERHP
jgi:hypothetical protein